MQNEFKPKINYSRIYNIIRVETQKRLQKIESYKQNFPPEVAEQMINDYNFKYHFIKLEGTNVVLQWKASEKTYSVKQLSS